MANTLEVVSIQGSNLKTEIAIGPNLRLLADGDKPKIRDVTWRILTHADGDKRIVWNPESFPEIRDAKDMFDECVKAGLVPYICDERGRPTGEVMSEFDPGSGEVIFKDVVFAPSRLAKGG